MPTRWPGGRSILAQQPSRRTAYSCHPSMPSTVSPAAWRGSFDSTTRPTTPPTITSPSPVRAPLMVTPVRRLAYRVTDRLKRPHQKFAAPGRGRGDSSSGSRFLGIPTGARQSNPAIHRCMASTYHREWRVGENQDQTSGTSLPPAGCSQVALGRLTVLGLRGPGGAVGFPKKRQAPDGFWNFGDVMHQYDARGTSGATLSAPGAWVDLVAR